VTVLVLNGGSSSLKLGVFGDVERSDPDPAEAAE